MQLHAVVHRNAHMRALEEENDKEMKRIHARLISRAVAGNLLLARSPASDRIASHRVDLLLVARLSASHFDGNGMSAVATATVRTEHSYDNERNSAKRGMAEEETVRGTGRDRGRDAPG